MSSSNCSKMLALFVALGMIYTGCSGTADKSASEKSPETTQTSSQSSQSSSSNEQESQTVDPNRQETKWIGTIPYDVFYDDPLTVAADPRRVGSTTETNTTQTEMTTEPVTSDTADSTTDATAASGEISWSEILPMEVLINETKSLRTRLSGNMQTLGTYNQSTAQISLDGAMMSALGAIGTVHDEDSNWKERAKFVRDLGYEVYMSADGTGRSAFKSTEDPFLKLLTSLDGGTVSDLSPDEVVPFADLIYGSEIMKRIESSVSNLKSNINTEARMKEDPEAVERELRVLAALGTIMGTDGYDSADAELYQQLIKKFVDGALLGVKGVQTEDYESFKNGVNQIQTTCSECHQQFRSNDSGF